MDAILHSWLFRTVLMQVARWLVAVFRRLSAGPGEKLLRPWHAGDLRLVFSSVPREPVTAAAAVPHPEFNYLAGPNEVDFAWTLYPILRRLVPVGMELHPITFSRQMYIGGVDTIPTANVELWKPNLLVSGSTKFNEVTRQLHSEPAQLPLNLVFVPEGGAITDNSTGQTYRAERRGGEVTADYGIFAKYPNPFDVTRTIVFVAGAESVYQLGITRTLVRRKEAKVFRRGLEARYGGRLPRYFEALVRAPGRGLEFTGPLEVKAVYALPYAVRGNRLALISFGAGVTAPVAVAVGWVVTYSPLTLRAYPTLQTGIDVALVALSVVAAVGALVMGIIASVRSGRFPSGQAYRRFSIAGALLGALEVIGFAVIAIAFKLVAAHP